ncbi:MAG: peptide deformylase [Deltaproteobacteria bacterium SG8_13]|nr:MAG: peptide deformylase [Deltaproteobacteria bacterium SG8_13]
MSLLAILTYPNRFLLQVTRPVDNIDGQLQQLIEDMAETMYAAPGVGLAANQVGSSRRILVFDEMSDAEKRQFQVIVNPKLIESDGELISENEGCLSVPEFRSDVRRAARVLVEGVDREGNPLRMEAEGFRAVVLQHEIDHLDGKLFIDRISSLKRQLYKRRVKKQQKIA